MMNTPIIDRVMMSIRMTIPVLLFSIPGFAQEMTPTPVAFDFRCLGGINAEESFLVNGDFEFGTNLGSAPPGWGDVASGLTGQLTEQSLFGIVQKFVTFQDGASISQSPQPNLQQDQFATNRYRLRFCAVVESGILTVEFDNEVITLDATSRSITTQYESGDITADLSEAGNIPEVIFTFNGDGIAFVDNVELLGFTRIGGDETPVPTPTEVMPTPSPEPTSDRTPLPTQLAGQPTWTPTPSLSASSVKVVADPPMLVLSPDDFIVGADTKKHILLSTRLIGRNGEEIDLANYENVSLRYRIDNRGDAENAGSIVNRRDNGTERSINNQRSNLDDLNTIIFVPGKAFDGTVRIIVDIEFDGEVNGVEEKQEIRGVVPIVFRTSRSASLTGAVGTFNLRNALDSGRNAGDRGFRPNQKTNLFFREVFQ